VKIPARIPCAGFQPVRGGPFRATKGESKLC